MQKVIDLLDKIEWQELAKTIADPFYTWEYSDAFSHMGKPKLFFYGDDYDFVIMPFILRDIGKSGYRDVTSPYGYSGPAYFGSPNLNKFLEAWKGYLKSNNIITEFTRLNPMINQNHYPRTDLCGKTVWVDLEKKPDLQSIEKSCRNAINRAKREKIFITTSVRNDPDYLEKFIYLYYKTMKRNNASKRYFFSKETIKKLASMDDTVIIWAKHKGKIIASAMFLATSHSKYAYYYLAGSDEKYKNLGVNNLILYDAMRFFYGVCKKKLCLGEGYSGEDSLFKFKSEFSSLTSEYHINKHVINKSKYDELSKGKKTDFFPAYREDECHSNGKKA